MSDEWVNQAADAFNERTPEPEQPDWVNQAAGDFEQRTHARTETALGLASGTNPDEFADLAKRAEALGLPPEIAQRQPDKTRELSQRASWREALKDSRTVREALQNPDTAKLAHDDVETLGNFEHYMRNTWQSLAGVGRGIADIGRAEVAGLVGDVGGRTLEGLADINDAAARSITRSLRAVGADPVADLLETPVPPAASLSSGARTIGGELREAGETIAPPEERRDFTTDVAGGIGQLVGQVGIHALLGPAASGLTLMGQGASIQGDRMPDGPRTAEQDLATALGAGVTAITERYQLDALLNRLPPNIRNAALRRITDYAIAGGGEAAQEVLEGIGQDIITGELVDPNFDRFEGLAYEGGVAGTVGFLGRAALDLAIPGRMSGSNYAQQADEAARAGAIKNRLDDVVATAEASKLRQRSPEQFRDLAGRILGEDADSVHLSAEDAETFFQDNPDAEQALRQSETAARSYDEARVTGGDVVIPAEDYVTYLAEYHQQGLGDKVRVGPDGMNAEEAAQWTEEQAQQFGEEVDRALARHAEDSAFVQSADRVAETIRDQVVASGRFTDDVAEQYAQLHRAFAVATADRLGVLPEQVYEQYGLQVRGATLGDGGVQYDQDAPTLRRGTVLWTGTQGEFEFGRPGLAYLANEPGEAMAYARGAIPGTGRGQTGDPNLVAVQVADDARVRDVDAEVADAIAADEDIDAAIEQLAEQARADGYDFITYNHPGVRADQFRAVVVANPDAIQPAESPFRIEALDDGRYEVVSDTAGRLGVFDDYARAVEARGDFEGGYFRAGGETYEQQARGALYQSRTGANVGVGGQTDGRTATDRPGVSAEQDALRTVGGGRATSGWAGATRVRRKDGRPAVVYRGAGQPLDAGNFDQQQLGAASGNPSSGLGVWFTPHQSEAAGYGAVEEFHLDIRKPKVYKVEDFPGFDDVAEAYRHREELRSQGYDGVAMDARHLGGPLHLVAFDPEQVIQPPREYEQQARGAIQFAADITDAPSTIALLENADLSTFLHESGHFFFEVWTDLASREGTPPGIRDDLQTLLDWYGVENLDDWRRLDGEQRREYHEQFARGFEAYLFEGNAPSTELQSLFQRFRSWLVSVYRNIRGLNVTLTDEVRGVMDRMLATDQQIRQRAELQAYQPLFESADEAGMTAAEFEEYRALGREAVEEAKDQLQQRTLRDMRWLSNAKSRVLRELQREARDKRKAIRAEVTDEVYREPVYAARRAMGRGIDAEGNALPGTAKDYRLNTEALADLYDGAPPRLPTGQYGAVTAEGGLHPDQAAEFFGFSSGDEMVRRLADAPPAREVIEGMTDQRMLERYGDLTDRDAMERAAEEALHNEARRRFVATEQRALARLTKTQALPSNIARRYAEARIARQKVRAIRPHQHTVEERRAARKAERARREDDLAAAARYKRDQQLAGELQRAATRARDEIDKALRYLKKFERAGVRKNLRGDFVGQLEALLARFDLRKGVSQKTLAERQGLREWIDQFSTENAAITPDIDPKFLDEAYRTHYKEMPLEELRGLVDTVKQLEHLARREQKMYLASREQSFQEEKEAIRAELMRVHPEAFDIEGEPKGFDKPYVPKVADKIRRLAQKGAAEFLNVETLVQVIGVGQFGQLHDSLVQRLSDRSDWKIDFSERLGEHLKPYFKAYTFREGQQFGSKGIYVPAIGQSLTREQIITVALYYGSETGRQRLRDGHGWGDGQVRAIIDQLEQKDWNLIDAIWRMHDEIIWPELEAVNQRTTGQSPPKVAPMPYQTRFGEVRGGYHPLVYDADLDFRQAKYDEGQAVQDMLGGNVWRASTPQGSSKQRVDELSKRLVLDFTGMNKAVGDTIHDIAYREAVADTFRIITDKGLRSTLETIGGPDIVKAIEQQIRQIAAVPRAPQGFIERTMGWARRNTMIVAMGFSIKTFLINATGIFASGSRVGPPALAREMARFSASPVEQTQFVNERSPYMRNRNRAFDRDLQRQVSQFRAKKRLTPDVATALAMVGWMDRAVAYPTWLGAYKEALNGKVYGLDTADETRAAQYADSIVRQTQGSGRDVDVSRIMEGGKFGPLKNLFTMFYSYFNAQLGQLVRSGVVRRAELKGGDPMAIARLATDFAAIVLLPAISGALLYGNCDRDVENADSTAGGYTKCFTRETALFMAGFVPVVRDVIAGTWRMMDKDTPYFGYQLSPAESAFEGVIKGFAAGYDIGRGEGNMTDVKQAILGTSYAVGLPGYQMWRTLEHAINVSEGDSEFNPWHMLMGEPKD